MKESFIEVDKKWEEHVKSKGSGWSGRNSGTTALVCLLTKEKLYIGNLGDTRGVMVRDNSVIRLSKDHKPSDLEEEDRIRNLGGDVMKGNATGMRVNGTLAVSRAIGDLHVTPYVIPEPFVTTIQLTNKDKLMVLACDGLWDVMSDEEAGDMASSHTAVYLRDIAYSRQSEDNISVVVVRL